MWSTANSSSLVNKVLWFMFFFMLFDTFYINFMGFNLKIYHFFLMITIYLSILIAFKNKKLWIHFDLSIFLFVVYMCVNAIIISEVHDYSVNKMIILIFFLISYTYISSLYINQSKIIQIIVNIGTITFFICLFQLLFKYLFDMNIHLFMEGRPQAFFSEPDWLGYFFLLTLPYSLYYVEHKKNYGYFLINLLGLLLSQARAAWVSIGLVLFLYLIFSSKENKVKYKFVVPLIVLTIGSFVVMYILFPQNQIFGEFVDRFSNIANPGHSTTRYRILILERAFELIEFNMWYGIGLDNFGLYFSNLSGMNYGINTGLWNLYLNMFIETGVVGLTLFLLFVFVNIIRKAKYYLATKNQLLKYNLISIVMMLVANNFSNGMYFLFFWINFAIGNSLIRNSATIGNKLNNKLSNNFKQIFRSNS